MIKKRFPKFVAIAMLFVLLFSLIPVGAMAASPWAPGVAYKAGDLAAYSGQTYAARQNHTSLVGWEPPNVPALWTLQPQQADTTAPSVPAGLKVVSKTSSSVALSWNASTDNVGVTGYDVYNGTALAGSTAATTLVVTGLQANAAYTFTVKAKDAAGNVSAASSALNVTTDVFVEDKTAPSAPTNVSAGTITNSSVTLAWTASTDNVGVTGYDVYNGGSLAGSTADTTFTVSKLNASTAYTFTVKAKDAAGNISAASAALAVTTKEIPPVTGKKLIGYWHNFDNGSTKIRLRDVNPKFDVINVAFAEQNGQPGGVQFEPYNATAEEFRADVAYLNSLGKKVVISLGGQNGYVGLNDEASKQNFINSLSAIIDKYGFNGIDIDLESGVAVSASLDADFKNPKSPFFVNIISAVKTLSARYPGFVLSMAPEVAYVQGGLVAYGGPWGGYLPIIYGLRDQLTYIHVQHYNAGSAEALDGKVYNQGTADFQVALTDMLLQGFPVAHNANNIFPPLRPDQVAFGLPSNASAAPSGGFTSNAEIAKALNYIVKGTSYGGSYVLRNPSGYPNFAGVMTWSINWDAATGSNFSTGVRAALDAVK